jgi:hypothetical protein
MPRVNAHVELCGTHLEAKQRRLRSEPAYTAQDVLDGITDLRSATSVNHVLANITTLLMDNRMDYRKAVVLAYLSQLLLPSISLASRERWDTEEPPPNNVPRLMSPRNQP